MSALARYTWPGNVRELSNLLERLSILYPGKVVDATQLPSKYSTLTNTDLETSEFLTESVALNEFAETEHFDQFESNSINNVGLPILTRDGVDLKSQIASVEQFYIKQALDLSNGVVAQAAKLLGLRRTTLVEKLKKHEFQRTATS